MAMPKFVFRSGAAGPDTPNETPSQAATTVSGLADQIHKMLTAKNVTLPNEVDKALQERYGNSTFIQSKKVLVVLKSSFGQEGFLQVKHKPSIKCLHFYSSETDYNFNATNHASSGPAQRGPPFDFANFSDMAKEHLPNLELLNIQFMAVKNFSISSSTIKTVRLVAPKILDRRWALKLPNLRELHLEDHSPPVDKFARSLIACPLLEKVFCHKYWVGKHRENCKDDGRGGWDCAPRCTGKHLLPSLFLPNCKSFIFRRSDGNSLIKFYIPRVEELVLDGNYNLDRIELLSQGHSEHSEWNLPQGTKHSNFRLSQINSNLSERALAALRGSGRVLNPDALKRRLVKEAGPLNSDWMYAEHHRISKSGNPLDIIKFMNETMRNAQQ